MSNHHSGLENRTKNASVSPDPKPAVHAPLTTEQLDAIRQFDSCSIANAIESFQVRLRNEGYTRPGLRFSAAEGASSMLGYTVTCRVKTDNPPTKGRAYYDRTDWWSAIDRTPAPRIVVLKDDGSHPGVGALVGGVHASILKALNCVGIVTNGAVRDLPQLQDMGMPTLAAFTCVSHAYAHMIEFDKTVEICGLKVHSGDLLFADIHGAVSIPLEIAAELPPRAATIVENDLRIIRFCQSPDFSLERLRRLIEGRLTEGRLIEES